MNNNITSANASAILTVESLYPAGIVLEQFGTDQALTLEDVIYTESRIGIDGKMSSGFVPSIKTVNLTIEASSPSMEALIQLGEMMNQSRSIYRCTLVCTVPSTGKTFTWSEGVLQSGKSFADMKKMLEPVTFKFQFPNFKVSQL